MPSSVGLGGTEEGGVAGEKRRGTSTMAELWPEEHDGEERREKPPT